MLRFFILLFWLVCIVACQPDPLAYMPPESARHFFSPDIEPMRMQQKVSLKIIISERETGQSKDLESVFWEKATAKGVKELARKFLQKHILIKGSMGKVPSHEKIYFFQKTGKIAPLKLPVTNDLMQKFEFEFTLIPDWKLAGQIKTIEDDRYIAGTHDRVTLLLFDYYPLTTPAFFVVGRQVAEDRTTMSHNALVRIVGFGKLTQALGPAARANIDDKSSGTLAHGIILEAEQEILRGDLIFLVMLKAEARPEIQTSPGQIPDVNEVVVEPEFVDEKPLHRETK